MPRMQMHGGVSKASGKNQVLHPLQRVKIRIRRRIKRSPMPPGNRPEQP